MAIRLITALALAFLGGVCAAYAGEERYVFTSVVGQNIVIARHSDPPNYSIKTEDVTVRFDSCDERTHRICFLGKDLSVAVPKKPPVQGATWSVEDDAFRVVSVIGNLEWLGRNIADVFVISVEGPHYGSGEHRFRLLFSYSEGLLAFQDEPGLLFIAQKLPSLGHSN